MEDLSLFSRRDFMKGATALGITGLALWSGACESACEKIKNRPTRRNIANLAANDPIIQTYKDAVAAMKALPAGDGRNWTKQAEIHNNMCPHRNWWFLPWHRAYLFNFEAICRKLTGNNDFALPYWNWTTSPSIPAPFWGNGNPLLNNTRVATQASVANSSIVGASDDQQHSEPNKFLSVCERRRHHPESEHRLRRAGRNSAQLHSRVCRWRDGRSTCRRWIRSFGVTTT